MTYQIKVMAKQSLVPDVGKPPGRKLVKRMPTRTKWLILAPVGLMLIGFGLCVFSGAAYDMNQGAPFMRWFIKGTYSLILINGGISIFGQAIRYRAMMDTRMMIRREFRKRDKEEERRRKIKKKASQSNEAP